MSRPTVKREIVCLCNEVSREAIERAIRLGADDMGKIYDATGAGVGPCGGSCRRKLGPMVDSFTATGEFPLVLVADVQDKPKR